MLRACTAALLRPRPSAVGAVGAVSLSPGSSLLSRLGLFGGHSWRALCISNDGARAPPTLPLRWRNVPPPVGYMNRAEAITMAHVGNSYLVHSGRDYKRVKVTAQMVAHKFGEFVLTRKRRPAPKKQQQGGKGQKRR
jgi:ribosomal protein S19